MVTDGALVTTVVGSYPQPEWLVNREMLGSRLPPRIRAKEIWRVPEEFLAEAQDDATVIAIRDMERAGIEIITDGEVRRESYSNRFATALAGMDVENPGTAIDRTGHPNPVPRAVGPIHRTRPVEVGDLEFLRRNTDLPVKITLPGPFTMAQQAQDDFYGERRSLALALAEAVRAEVVDLFAAGADIVQLDEPYLQARPEAAREYGVEAINRAVGGLSGTVALHTCFGYAAIVHERPPGYPFLAELNDCAADLIAIETAQPDLDLALLKQIPGKGVILGVVDLGDPEVESAESIANRIRRALEFHAPDRLQIAPDCGMKYLPRDRAFAKLQAMTEAARIVRAELG
ncbi:methionine synthase [Acrocarpospora phusangensis]|uniref:Methionine synthase n=1 Tax=Acrocarpospora phusangensis TaxID=1070424 RepID=A0A919QCS6_9ACTN|nr:cobalamin-independent methionine synthase II family protein [Acrocarpospora phusangensis]GIH24990.1 methionine synthase [Acrocarpospora phusangensis]